MSAQLRYSVAGYNSEDSCVCSTPLIFLSTTIAECASHARAASAFSVNLFAHSIQSHHLPTFSRTSARYLLSLEHLLAIWTHCSPAAMSSESPVRSTRPIWLLLLRRSSSANVLCAGTSFDEFAVEVKASATSYFCLLQTGGGPRYTVQERPPPCGREQR